MTGPADQAALDALANEIAWMQAARPLARLPDLTFGPDGRVRLDHPHLTGTVSARTGLHISDAVDADGPSADFRTMIRRAIADIRRREARAGDITAAGLPPPPAPNDRGRSDPSVPAWAMLVHPVLAYALAMARADAGHAVDPADPLGLWPIPEGSTGTHSSEHDLVLGGLSIGPVRVGVNAVTASLTLTKALPDTLATALAGQPLAALVELPPCGLPAVDAAVAELRIAVPRTSGGMATMPNGASLGPFPTITSFRLAPTRWLRAGPDPIGFAPTWEEAHPYVA